MNATPIIRGTVKDAKDKAICRKGMGIVLPTSGVPSKYTQREVKAKLLTVERKVMVQDRLISPWNIAV